MLKTIFRLVLVFAGAASILAGIIYLGQSAQDQLRRHEKYQFSFAAIDCPAPPRMSRSDFLDEVRYAASMPKKLRILEKQLPEQLANAFAKHPWVAKVDGVVVSPPNQIAMQLTFRTPVLAVKWNGQMRAVDAAGVLLPMSASTEGLPLYTGKPARPKGPEGTLWGDTAIVAAAKEAARNGQE